MRFPDGGGGSCCTSSLVSTALTPSSGPSSAAPRACSLVEATGLPYQVVEDMEAKSWKEQASGER